MIELAKMQNADYFFHNREFGKNPSETKNMLFSNNDFFGGHYMTNNLPFSRTIFSIYTRLLWSPFYSFPYSSTLHHLLKIFSSNSSKFSFYHSWTSLYSDNFLYLSRILGLPFILFYILQSLPYQSMKLPTFTPLI